MRPSPQASVPLAPHCSRGAHAQSIPSWGSAQAKAGCGNLPCAQERGWSPGSMEEQELAPQRRQRAFETYHSAVRGCRGGHWGPSVRAEGGQQQVGRQGGGEAGRAAETGSARPCVLWGWGALGDTEDKNGHQRVPGAGSAPVCQPSRHRALPSCPQVGDAAEGMVRRHGSPLGRCWASPSLPGTACLKPRAESS